MPIKPGGKDKPIEEHAVKELESRGVTKGSSVERFACARQKSMNFVVVLARACARTSDKKGAEDEASSRGGMCW